jgi:hypothetical protein
MPMFLSGLLLAALAGAALAKGPLPEADEGPDPRGLTLSGSGVARVKAPSRLSDATIERAIEAAKPKALARALEQARARAKALAAVAGLTLGEVRAVAVRDPEVEFGLVEPRRHCRRSRAVERRRGPRCRVPAFTAATVAVTFATEETSAVTTMGRAIVASHAATAAVKPRNRRSSASIRHALFVGKLAAAPAALRGARHKAMAAARATAIDVGPVFSIAEVRRPADDFGLGSFGPGRFCGTVRRPIFARDPATGRRRVVRRVRERRCYYPRDVPVALRMTFLPR